MFFPYTDENIRYTGRWGKEIDQCGVKVGCMTATTTGAYFEFVFKGRQAVLHFNVISQNSGMPHVWVSVDGGTRVESVVMPYLRVQAADEGVHTVCVIIKCANEELQRWYRPLTSCVALCGITADELCPLPADERKVIEFVGDSITEGVLVDEPFLPEGAAAFNRLYQNDACGTYAWLTAEALGLRPIIMGYGAVGVTKGGNGGVPKAQEAYPYNYHNSPISCVEPDYIFINHGSNDDNASEEAYCEGYRELLDTIRRVHPHSHIIAMAVLYGVHTKALEQLITAYNSEHKTNISFINASGWVPKEPLHPLREGHKIAAEKLTEALKKVL